MSQKEYEYFSYMTPNETQRLAAFCARQHQVIGVFVAQAIRARLDAMEALERADQKAGLGEFMVNSIEAFIGKKATFLDSRAGEIT